MERCTSPKRVLVIGASGRVGREVVSQLISIGAQVSALARNPDAARLPPEVQTRQGDLTVPHTLDQCLDGTEAVFLVWCAPLDTARDALERLTRRRRHIVFLSSPHKTADPFFQQPSSRPSAAVHAEIERLIEGSGCPWTFLRPGMFAANARFWWGEQIRAGGVVRWPYALAATAPIDERDIAAIAVRALYEEGHAGAEYVLTGAESLTQAGQVATIGEAIGRPLRMEEITPEEARREWFSAIPQPIVDMLFDAWAAAIGRPAFMTSTFAEITGTPARTFGEWARDHAAEFRKRSL